MIYDMIYLLTAIGLTPGGSSTVHIYTQTIHRTTQNKQYIEQHNNFGRVRAVPRLCELYPGICLTTEEKARKTLSQGSRRVPVGTMKTEYIGLQDKNTGIRIPHRPGLSVVTTTATTCKTVSKQGTICYGKHPRDVIYSAPNLQRKSTNYQPLRHIICTEI